MSAVSRTKLAQYAKHEVIQFAGLTVMIVAFASIATTLPLIALEVGCCLLLGVSSFFIFFQYPSWAVWLVLGLLFFGNRTELPALYFWGRYLPTLGLAAFVGAVFSRLWLRGVLQWKGKHLLFGYSLFVVLLLFSAVYNQSSLRDVLLSLFTNLRYPLFFLALINADLQPQFYRRVFAVFVALTLLQIPVCLIEFGLGQKSDELAGTMGANGPLIAVTLISQCALLGRWLTASQPKPYYVCAILALLTPGLLGDIQIGLVFFPLLAGFIIFRYYGLRRFARTISYSTLLLLLGGGVVLGAAQVSPIIREFFSVLPEYQSTLTLKNPFLSRESSVGRLTIIPLSFPLLLAHPIRLVWGFGPEAAQGGLLTATLTSASNAENAQGGVVCQALEKQGLLCRESQSFRALMEFGFLGSLLYLLPMLRIWRHAAQSLRRADSTDSRALWLFFEGASFLFIVLGVWYAGVWRVDSYSFPFWFLAAAVYTEVRARGGAASLPSSQRA